jgi:hypothetical protein
MCTHGRAIHAFKQKYTFLQNEIVQAFKDFL